MKTIGSFGMNSLGSIKLSLVTEAVVISSSLARRALERRLCCLRPCGRLTGKDVPCLRPTVTSRSSGSVLERHWTLNSTRSMDPYSCVSVISPMLTINQLHWKSFQYQGPSRYDSSLGYRARPQQAREGRDDKTEEGQNTLDFDHQQHPSGPG